ncbi:MAG: hypothetical protein JWP08_1854 [Bryobacterales bacterium]|jgi:hypothetical protein|nr:hypothetical protein [Bryobacterales bacterium]
MNKPFHLMNPAERTAARIAENRAITERIAQSKTAPGKTAQGKSTKASVQSSGEGTRATPAERGKLGSLIRKVQR